MASASINFGAAKLTVSGTLSDEALSRMAGAHGLGLQPVGQEAPSRPQRISRRELATPAAGVALLAGWLASLAGADVPVVFGLYLFTIVIGGGTTFARGVRALRMRRLDMNVLMMVAVLGAMAIGEWSEAAVVSFLFGVSHFLESRSLDKARASIRRLIDLAPKEAQVKVGSAEERRPVTSLAVGDVVVIRPGEQIPADGEVMVGESHVDASPITGESMPAPACPGSRVFAGSVNQQGYLEVRVEKAADDTTLAKIVHLVEEAQARRAPAQKFVDRFASVYTPLVMLAAVVTALMPPLLLGGGWPDWLYRGLALLVVACPCALVVSTPVTLLAAMGAAARHGILIKGGAYLEALASVQAVAFDKTGTLTHGHPKVTDVYPLPGIAASELLARAAAVERRSEHPLARAIVRQAGDASASDFAVDAFEAIVGQGARAQVDGEPHLVGSRRMLEEHSIDSSALAGVAERLEEAGKTVVWVAAGHRVLGVIAVADTIRSAAAAALSSLKELGIAHLVMLTGDNPRTAAGIARSSGLTEYRAEMLPDQKAAVVAELRRQYGGVAMIGDGVNDAPALATATVGVAMGGAGTDTALETADVVLMTDDLSRLPFALKLSRRALRIVKQNIAFSLALKAVAILLVYPGWLTLWLAILGDMGATILVTLNGARLLAERPTRARQNRSASLEREGSANA